MLNRVLVNAALLLVLGLAGCAGPARSDGDGFGIVVSTVGRSIPREFGPAYIIEIDGVRLSHVQRAHRLTPGRHTIRVVPELQGSSHHVPQRAALARQIENSPLELDVEVGRLYEIGLRVLEPINIRQRRGRWEAVVVRVRGAESLSEYGDLGGDPESSRDR